MEKFKRRFSIDAPIPYSKARRQSEPVIFQRRASAEPEQLPLMSRRYSTAIHTPVATNLGRRSFEKHMHDYSSNHQVRKLSMEIALQEALNEEYGHTPIYQIPLMYSPPPATLQTSTHTLQLKTHKTNCNKNKLRVISGNNGLADKIESVREESEIDA